MHIQHLCNERAENTGDEPDNPVFCWQSKFVQAIQLEFSLHSRYVGCPINGGARFVCVDLVIASCIDQLASVA